METLDEPVEQFYKGPHCWYVRLATSSVFQHLTLVMIFLNWIWLWIDADYNPEPLLFNAQPGFIAVELIFVVFFVSWKTAYGLRFCALFVPDIFCLF